MKEIKRFTSLYSLLFTNGNEKQNQKRMKQFTILLMSWFVFQSTEAQTPPTQNLFGGFDYSKHCSSGMSKFDFSREYYKMSIKRTEYCINTTSTISQNFIMPDGYSYRIDQNSGTLCFDFLQKEKQTTFSDGHVDMCSDIITSKKVILGVKAGFQTDINAEAILHLTLFAGRKFCKPFLK